MRNRFEVDALNGSILKNMLLFSLPVMGTALLQMLFSVADTAVIGKFGHEGAISAMGAPASVIQLLVGALSAIGSGVTVVLGKLCGEGSRERFSKVVNALPLTAAIMGFALSIVAIAMSKPILGWMNCPEELLKDARAYFCIYFVGVPFSLMFTFLSAVLNARGNSFLPFVFQISTSVLNVALNLLFVIVFDWNVVGVGIATVISQIASAAAITVYLATRKDETRLVRPSAFRGLGEVFKIGIPASAEGSVLSLSSVIIGAAVNRFDSTVIAGNALATQVEGIAVISFLGFSSAGVVFVSQNFGKGNFERVMRIFKTVVPTVLIGGEILGTFAYLASPYLLRIFTDDAAIIEAARSRMLFMCLAMGFCGLMNVLSGLIRGLGEARLTLIISVICSVAFRITWIYTYAAAKGTVEAIYVSYPICWVLNTVLSISAFLFTLHRKKLSTAANDAEEQPRGEPGEPVQQCESEN